MEAIATEIITVIAEMAVEELVIAIAATHCCARSKKKWDKVKKKLFEHKDDRKDRVLRRVKSMTDEELKSFSKDILKISSI